MIATLNLLAGIGFDPAIRGWLVVLVGVAVLMGSVWLLLVTNSGIRLGTLIALAGFFGWMAIMGLMWWLYGIGYEGDSPSWHTVDINVGNLSASTLDEATELPDRDELLAGTTPFQLVLASGNETAIAEFDPELTFTDEELAGFDEVDIAYRQLQRERRVEVTTLSEVAAVSPELTAGLPLGDWRLLSTADAGEAQAQATADLAASGLIDGSGFLLLEAYDYGGKETWTLDNPEPERGFENFEGTWKRAGLFVRNTWQVLSPPQYAVVQVQQTITTYSPPGQPPAQAVLDPSAPVISIVMERDLGNERLPPFMTMLGSLIIFLVLCYVLHVRDQAHDENITAFEATKKK